MIKSLFDTINSDALQFLSESGSWRLVETTGDVRASSFLFQRISVALVQRFNSALLHNGFVDDDWPEQVHCQTVCRLFLLCFLGHLEIFPGLKI